MKKRTLINAPVEDVFKWHTREGALQRLSPPWDPIKVIEYQGNIDKGSEVVLVMKAGPIPYKWHAIHTEYIENSLFRDIQVKGPFSEWVHSHKFDTARQTMKVAPFLHSSASCLYALCVAPVEAGIHYDAAFP